MLVVVLKLICGALTQKLPTTHELPPSSSFFSSSAHASEENKSINDKMDSSSQDVALNGKREMERERNENNILAHYYLVAGWSKGKPLMPYDEQNGALKSSRALTSKHFNPPPGLCL